MSKTWTREERYRVLQDPEELRPLHDAIRQSPYRQTCHVQPVTGLLNDPNGFGYHDVSAKPRALSQDTKKAAKNRRLEQRHYVVPGP